MAAAVGLTIVKKFTYRGDAGEEWSNQYWFTGSVPADATSWETLFDALVLQEKTLYTSAVSVIRGYGYDSDADGAVAVWSIDHSLTPIAGTLSIGTGSRQHGDAAGWVRWETSRLNSKGRKIYLRKYYHDVITPSATSSDLVMAAQLTKYNDFGTKLRDGTFIDSRTLTARGHTDTLLSSGGSTYVTTHTLKRRGRRPTPA